MTSDLDELRVLARACLDADGGLPLLTDDGMLRARLASGKTLDIRDGDGVLVASANVVVGTDAAATSGLVHPGHRGRGHGRNLVAWARAEAGDRPLVVTCENVSPAAERLYARAGLERVFAEDVLRHDLATVPHVPLPDGVTVVPVTDASRDDLFAAYVGSFADRPGFPDPSRDEWLEELEEDDEWRRDVSAVVLDADGGPVAFLNVLGSWVDQVGVVPAWRGRRLGAHLVTRALGALAAEDAGPAWLTVNLDNPAGALYRSLGFVRHGTRGRWA
ncbi:hypothetical protein GCM10009795_025300 [Nocardioides hankookensis]|uniref:GNAT family N-acetyltransferase n=1 Tax=Nocardioides hankookensis TaxID=443157 RepID=A0ABW1LCY1_9ACTN